MTRLVEHPPISFSARAALDGTVGGTWRSAIKLIAAGAAGVLLALLLPTSASAWVTEGGSNGHTFATKQGFPPPYETIWVKRVRHEIGGLLEHAITIGGGRIYAITLRGTVVALSPETGEEIWRREVPGIFATSPSYFRERIYFQSHTARHKRRRAVFLYALDAATGETLWTRILRAAHSEGSPNIVGGNLYIGTVNRNRRTDRYSNGAVRSYTLGGRLRWIRATCGTWQPPVWTGRRLVAADRCGVVRAYTTRGRVVWRTRVASSVGAQLGYAAGRIVVHAKAGIVYALRARSGRQIWARRVGWATGYPDCSVTRSRIVCGNYDGTVAAFTARRGHQLWRRNYGGGLLSAVVATRRMLWIAPFNWQSGRGRVLGLNPRNGRVLLSFWSGRYDPAAADGDRVYIIHSRHIRALQSA
jgi:outer membrane protein assembly factor BamB